MTTTPATRDETDAARSALFADRLSAAHLGAVELLNVELGSRLKSYERLAALGSVTADRLATAAGISERYARLEQQTVAGMVEVDEPPSEEQDRRFALPPAHARVLLDRDSGFYLRALARSLPALAARLGAVTTSFPAAAAWSRLRCHPDRARLSRCLGRRLRRRRRIHQYRPKARR